MTRLSPAQRRSSSSVRASSLYLGGSRFDSCLLHRANVRWQSHASDDKTGGAPWAQWPRLLRFIGHASFGRSRPLEVLTWFRCGGKVDVELVRLWQAKDQRITLEVVLADVALRYLSGLPLR